jgi:hypothetical protein
LIADRKDHLQGEPTRESICQNPEHLARAAGEEQEGLTISAGGASVEVTEEDPHRWRGSHGNIDVLRFENRGVGGPTSSIADVCQCGTDGVDIGGSTFSEFVRCPCKTSGREAVSCRVGSREPPREGVGSP